MVQYAFKTPRSALVRFFILQLPCTAVGDSLLHCFMGLLFKGMDILSFFFLAFHRETNDLTKNNKRKMI